MIKNGSTREQELNRNSPQTEETQTMFRYLFPKHFAKHLNNLFAPSARPRLRPRVRLSLESLEDRVTPTMLTVVSPNGHWVASVQGFPGVESVQVAENGSGRVVYQSGGYTDIEHLTWSPNSLEVAWVQQSGTNVFSYDWAGVLPSPSSVPAYFTPLAAPVFSADSSLLTFPVPGNPPQVSFAVPTTPPAIHITGVPSTVTAGSLFQVTITAPWNDFDGGPYTGNLPLGSSDGQPVLPTSTVSMKYGLGACLIQLNKSDTLSIRASEGSWLTGSSPSFTVSPAGVSSFVFTAPSTAYVGAPFNVTLTAKDPFGNTATGFSGIAALGCYPSQPVSPATVQFSNGEATAAVTLNTAGTCYLQATDGVAAGTSGTIAVSKAKTTTTLAVSNNPSIYGQPVTFTATVRAVAPASGTPTGSVTFVVDGGTPTPVLMNALGQASLTLPALAVGKHTINASFFANPSYENSDVTITQTVNLAVGPATLPADAPGEDYSATISATGGSGKYSYTLSAGALPPGLSLSGAGVLSGRTTVTGTYNFTIKATDTVLSGVTGSEAYTLSIHPGAPTSVTVSAPSTATAGTAFRVTVTAQDDYGNGYSGPATLSSSDGQAVTPASVSLVNGTATVYVTLKAAGTVALTATAAKVTGTSADITVNPAAAVRFVVSAPSKATAGSSFAVTITALDAYGNVVTGSNGSVKLYSSDGQTVTPISVTLSNGTVTVPVTLDVAHTVVLTAGNGVIGGSSSLIAVSPALTDISVSAPGTATAGIGFTVKLTCKDAFGNGYTGLVNLASSDGQPVTPVVVQMTNGSAIFPAVLKKAGTVTLTATADSLTGTSADITVNPAVAVKFVVSAPGTATVGIGFNITITAEDAFGNVVTGYNGSVRLYCSDGQAVTPAGVTLSNGKATVAVTLKIAHTVTLTAGDGVIGGTSGLIVVDLP
jgi:hypothetical protein